VPSCGIRAPEKWNPHSPGSIKRHNMSAKADYLSHKQRNSQQAFYSISMDTMISPCTLPSPPRGFENTDLSYSARDIQRRRVRSFPSSLDQLGWDGSWLHKLDETKDEFSTADWNLVSRYQSASITKTLEDVVCRAPIRFQSSYWKQVGDRESQYGRLSSSSFRQPGR
jgi:hypothetical protein